MYPPWAERVGVSSLCSGRTTLEEDQQVEAFKESWVVSGSVLCCTYLILTAQRGRFVQLACMHLCALVFFVCPACEAPACTCENSGD